MKRWLFLSLLLASLSPLEAAYLFKDGAFIDVKDIADKSIHEHYNLGLQAIQDKQWLEAAQQFRIVTISFPEADLTKEAYYFLGISYYHAGDVDLANKNLSLYLENQKTPKYFIETFRYKLAVANPFRKA